MASGFNSLYSASSVLILVNHSSKTCCGLALSAGNAPIIPALHCAITKSGPETKNNGAVFSVGSIAWGGSMAWNKFQNNVSKITQNVLNRFLDKKGFN